MKRYMMTEEQKIVWSAGFFDGEGCVGVHKQRRSDSSWISYVLHVAVSQRDKEPLELLQTLYGGSLYDYKRKGVTYWRWVCGAGTALRFLQTIKPFLIVKRSRAEIGIEFQEKLQVWSLEYGRVGYPSHVHQERDEIYRCMRELNRRGVSDVNPSPKRPGAKRGSKHYFGPKVSKQQVKETSGLVQ